MSNMLHIIKRLIQEEQIEPQFTSNELVNLANGPKASMYGLDNFKISSIATFPANASITHPDLGEIFGTGVPVKRGLQKPHFWRVGKSGKSLVFELIPQDNQLQDVHPIAGIKQNEGTHTLTIHLTTQQIKTIQSTAYVLATSTEQFIVDAVDHYLSAKGLRNLK